MSTRIFAGSRPSTVPQALAYDFVACCTAAALIALCDTLQLAWRSHPSLGLSGLYVCVGVALGAWFAALAAIILTPCRVLGWSIGALRKSPEPGPLLRGLGYSLLALAMGAVLLRPWELGLVGQTYRPIFGLGLLILIATTALSYIWRRSPGGAAWLAAAAAGTVLFADATVLVSVYPRWHDTALVAALALASVASRGIARLAEKKTAIAIAVMAFIAQLALLPSLRGVVELGAEKGVAVSSFVSSARWFLDKDGDRFAGALSGGDCNDNSDAVFPGQCEVPNNGIDDNCNSLIDPKPASGLVAQGARVLRDPKPDIYFILLDGTRADFAGTPRAQIAPAIERLASESLQFEHAYTSYPSTFRAVSTLQASRYWRYLTRHDELFFTVAARAGWDVALWIRDQRLKEMSALFDLDRKNDPFNAQGTGKLGWTSKIVDGAIAELNNASAPPRLRWLHVLDSHAPWLRGESSAPDRERYELEVAAASHELGRLFEALRSSPRGQHAVIILMADHGEALGEHGAGTHGGTLYEELLQVPLLMRLPGVPPGTITGIASLLDVVPTLSHYLGLAPLDSWQGFDWISSCDADTCSLTSQGPKPRVLAQLQASAAWGYAGLPALQAVSDGRYKLLVDLDRGRRMVFDLDRDPHESAPLAEPPPAALSALEATLAQWEDLPDCSNRL
ncbi:MAG TPA: sulfatase-like hydrolase/transferase [Polyangiaceae bacterium]|nr:sulfatase-like hydrolase/transferase [Polyangiaceae bacterium]